MKEKKNSGGDTTNKNIKDLEKEVKRLALLIDKVEDEKLQVENQLKHALADYQNLVKNSEKRENLRIFQAKKNLFESLIPSLDAMMLAKESSSELGLDEKGKSWLEGIVATLDGINRSMKEMGLEQYVPEKGEGFNNEKHEAVAVVEQGEKGKIFDIVQPGYILNDTVIRPARVVVSK